MPVPLDLAGPCTCLSTPATSCIIHAGKNDNADSDADTAVSHRLALSRLRNTWDECLLAPDLLTWVAEKH
jgi:hypothetical protein